MFINIYKHATVLGTPHVTTVHPRNSLTLSEQSSTQLYNMKHACSHTHKHSHTHVRQSVDNMQQTHRRKAQNACSSIFDNMQQTHRRKAQNACSSIFDNMQQTHRRKAQNACSSIFDNMQQTHRRKAQNACSSIFDNMQQTHNEKHTRTQEQREKHAHVSPSS
jgi:triacylglycerol esterase/lipase EstA (alpha/beta hydrolase family)